jgi:methionyl-tRNA formyltransferase
MKTYALLTDKPWHNQLFKQLQNYDLGNWVRIETKEELVNGCLSELNPEIIFIPHWSYILPKSIFENFECIVFHMTDLPYGRGGSPLQNLIINGHTETKLSALKVSARIDEGPIYLKKDLSLEGSAKEIFSRSTDLIEEMIIEIIVKSPIPEKQFGEPIFFSRRRPEESNISNADSLNDVYNHIRMLDAEGYPHAYFETQNIRFEFTNADFSNPDQLTADVRITKK